MREGFTAKPASWYKTLMRVFFLLLCAAVLLFCAQPSLAAKVVLVSSEELSESSSEEQEKRSASRELKASKDQDDLEKKERLLQELRELYKQGRSSD